MLMHRCHCGLDPQSRGVVTRHAEYLLDTTVAQARTGFKAVSTALGYLSESGFAGFMDLQL